MSTPRHDYRGREVRPVSSRQAAKLEALLRSEPSLLLLEQDDDGTIHFSVRARFLRGRLHDPRAGRLDPAGRLIWGGAEGGTMGRT
jgi:hypothetical protein